jgi:hypothetical protein
VSERLRAVVEALGIRPGERRFDLVVAVRVGLFHREPGWTRALVAPWLAPGGPVRALYDAPGGG